MLALRPSAKPRLPEATASLQLSHKPNAAGESSSAKQSSVGIDLRERMAARKVPRISPAG